MNIPILDLSTQYATIKSEIQQAVMNVLDQGVYILGSETQTLEKSLAEYCDTRYALGTSSGTDALLLALLAIGLKPGDEVITSPFTFFASAETVSLLRGKPVFVDIDPQTFNLDPSQLSDAITPKTKAIMPVHIFGQCADMDPILKIAKQKSLPVIEDACQAIGAKYKGRKSCSMGDFAALSFYPSKNLGAYGDAGMLFVKEEGPFLVARELRTHGEFPKTYQPNRIGMNARMGTIQAAILNVKFKYLETWNQKRQSVAKTYDRLFHEADLLKHVTLPHTASHNQHVFHLYVILTQYKEALIGHLKEAGIQAGNYFPIPLQLLKCYKELGYQPGDLPVVERVCSQTVALPLFPEITIEQQEYVVSSVSKFFKTKSSRPRVFAPVVQV